MNKTWEERFDEKFKIFEQVSGDEADGTFAIEEDRKRVKSFIAQILEEEIANYQRDYEQKHIASALQLQRKIIIKKAKKFMDEVD